MKLPREASPRVRHRRGKGTASSRSPRTSRRFSAAARSTCRTTRRSSAAWSPIPCVAPGVTGSSQEGRCIPRAPGPLPFSEGVNLKGWYEPYYQSLALKTSSTSTMMLGQLGSSSWIRSGSFCANRQRSGPPRAVESAMGLGDSPRVPQEAPSHLRNILSLASDAHSDRFHRLQVRVWALSHSRSVWMAPTRRPSGR
jgi:hypothetical protein